MKLEELSGDERTLVVVALQALHRERLPHQMPSLRSVVWPERSSRRKIFLGCVKFRMR
jgi:hypothetical protein